MSGSISQYQFWYDGVQRRYLEQIVRGLSGFSYQTGMRNGQPPQTVLVPCRMALTNRMVANVINNLSENTLNTVPMITVFQTGLRGRKADLQNPWFVDKLQAFERNVQGNQYGQNRGASYEVDRLMPLPFEMDVQVDIWTSNLEQKYQLAEQILVAIYPEFEIQNSDNPLDWSAVTVCFVEDDISFSSRTLPIGTSDEIDIMTLRLRVPMWLSAPAKVKRLRRIEEIVANVGQEQFSTSGDPVMGDLFKQVIVTPGDHSIAVDGSEITLLAAKGAEKMPDGSLPSWQALFNDYGTFNPGVSQLHLMLTDDIEGPFVAGTLQTTSAADLALWTIDADTLPANTLLSVNAVVDPMRTSPVNGLPTPQDGDRYLIIQDIGPCVAWSGVTAHTNDIIQYNSVLGQWHVAFDSRTVGTEQYVLNSHTNRQLYWNGTDWVMTIDNHYGPGYWRIILNP